jgi:Na+/glutamate symporter
MKGQEFANYMSKSITLKTPFLIFFFTMPLYQSMKRENDNGKQILIAQKK